MAAPFFARKMSDVDQAAKDRLCVPKMSTPADAECVGKYCFSDVGESLSFGGKSNVARVQRLIESLGLEGREGLFPNEEQMTIVMVTHDLSVASFAEQILLYKDDRMESEIRQGEGGMAHVLEDFLAKLQT